MTCSLRLVRIFFAGGRSELHDEAGEVVDEELGQDLEVVLPVLDHLVPHVHDEQVVVMVDEPLTDLIELGEELEALVVDQAGEDERFFLCLLHLLVLDALLNEW